jgi:CRP/FNR family cyclic AMP-dependent transcriptional regulator
MENYKIDFLKGVPLLSSLSEKEVKDISDKIILKEVRKNETILSEEDTNRFMYIIVFGKVKVLKTTDDGRDTIIALHKSGEFFGEMSLIDGRTEPATVVAMEDSLIGIISKTNFHSLLRQQEKILDAFLQILCLRLRDSWNKIQLLNFKYASQRIRTLFRILSETYGERTADGLSLKINLTHQDIADMTGLTRETTTRVLDRWQKEGDVAILKKKGIRLSRDFLQKTDAV